MAAQIKNPFENREQLANLLEHDSVRHLSAKLKIGEKTIRRFCREMNVPTPNRSEAVTRRWRRQKAGAVQPWVIEKIMNADWSDC